MICIEIFLLNIKLKVFLVIILIYVHIYKSIYLGMFSYKTLMTTLQNTGCHFVSCFNSILVQNEFWVMTVTLKFYKWQWYMLLAIIHFLFVCLFVCFIYFLKIPVTEMLGRNMQLQHGQTYSHACSQCSHWWFYWAVAIIWLCRQQVNSCLYL